MYPTTEGKKIRGASAFCKSTPHKESVFLQNENPRNLVLRASALKGYLTGVARKSFESRTKVK